MDRMYCLAPVAALAVSTLCSTAASADPSEHHRNAYVVTPLVSDIAGAAATPDPVLQNAWGVAFSPAGSPFWINDNATGCSSLYDGTGGIVSLKVKIPLPGNVVAPTSCMHNDPNNPPAQSPAAPTGIVWNASSRFVVPGTTTAAAFIFATEDGTISAWAGGLTPPDHAVLAADNSASGAVYKGLVFALNPTKGPLLFATNFHAATVDVYAPGTNGMYALTTTDGGFTDPAIPAGYAPFGIQSIDGDLFVTYALQNSEQHDDVAGPGHGFVDVFDTDGHLLRRFASRGHLNSPWGIAPASFNFGPFSGTLLIGNFGDGHISVYNRHGDFLDQLRDGHGHPIVIPGLWNVGLGGGSKSSPDAVYFTAGPNDEKDGMFGTIAPAD